MSAPPRDPEWFRETFEGDWHRGMRAFISPERNAADLSSVIRLLERGGVRAPSVVGDLPAGAARIARPLALSGYRVVALDLAWGPLADARRLVGEELLGRSPAGASDPPGASPRGVLHLVRGDLRALPLRDGALDAALCLEISLGYTTPDSDRRILAAMFRAVRPGGLLLVDMDHMDGITAGLRASSFYEDGGVRAHVTRRFDEHGRFIQRFSWSDAEGRSGTGTTDYHIYAAAELRALVLEAGFRVEAEYGSLPTLDPFTTYSRRWVAVASRPPV